MEARSDRDGQELRAHELIASLRQACGDCISRGAWLWLSLDEARGDLERLLAARTPPAFQVRCAIARAQMVLGVWHGISGR
jgi:hypothetical protein